MKTEYSIQTLYDKKWHTETAESPMAAAKQFMQKTNPSKTVRKVPASVLRNTLSMSIYSLIVTIKGGRTDKYKRHMGKYAPNNHYEIIEY